MGQLIGSFLSPSQSAGDSARTKFSPRLVRAEWGRCIAHAMPAWVVTSR
jgi:hypothetical protein